MGKTHVAVRLVSALSRAGISVAGFKPVACGDREDAEQLRAAGSDPGVPLDLVNPQYFLTPAAPLIAAREEQRGIDFCALHDSFEALCSTHEVVIVEGAGGWDVPLTGERTLGDLAGEWGSPVVIVAADRLGVLNHLLLTVAAVRRRGLRLAGLLLNSPTGVPSDPVARNAEALKLLGGLPRPVPCPADGSPEWLGLAREWLELPGLRA